MPKTASLVVRASDYVSCEMQHRICNSSEQLGYGLNRTEQRHASTQSTTIRLIMPSIRNAFFAELIASVQKAALAHDYIFVLATPSKSETAQSCIV